MDGDLMDGDAHARRHAPARRRRHQGRATAVGLVLLALLTAACSDTSFEDEVRAATGEPTFVAPAPTTRAAVFARGSDPEQPTDTIVVAAPSGSPLHEIAIDPALVRLRQTASTQHVLVLRRTVEATSTSVAVLDVLAGTLTDVDLPPGDWEAIRLLGTPTIHPGTLSVLIDEEARSIAIVNVTSGIFTIVNDVPDADAAAQSDAAPPALRIAPVGDAGLLTLPDGARIVSAVGTTRRLSGPQDEFTFVRWLGDGRGLEYVRTSPGEQGILHAEPLVGTAAARVRVGAIDASLPSTSGLVLVQNRTMYVVGRDGARELHTGDGPFVLPVAVDAAGSRVLVFDGAGGGFRNDLVDLASGDTRTVSLPAGANPAPATIGGSVVWFASADGIQPVVALDLVAGTATQTYAPEPDQGVDPTLLRPSPTGAHALARVGTSLTALALRVVLLDATGAEAVELAQGRNADGEFSADGLHVLVTWDPVENPIDRLGRVAVYDVGTGTLTDLGPGHEAIWVGA